MGHSVVGDSPQISLKGRQRYNSVAFVFHVIIRMSIVMSVMNELARPVENVRRALVGEPAVATVTATKRKRDLARKIFLGTISEVRRIVLFR